MKIIQAIYKKVQLKYNFDLEYNYNKKKVVKKGIFYLQFLFWQ